MAILIKSGRRDSVFTGMPYAVYLPPETEFEIEAITDNFEVRVLLGACGTGESGSLDRP